MPEYRVSVKIFPEIKILIAFSFNFLGNVFREIITNGKILQPQI